MKLRMTVAYDGESYAGWQRQVGGNTVQDYLEAAVERIARERIPVHGSGRTDAGVHAVGQVAHFAIPESLRMNPADWQRALNSYLPPRIRVMNCRRVPDTFHARFSASGKHYRYVIDNQPVLPPGDFARSWHVPLPLDRERLQIATRHLLGTHDFRSFAANRGRVEKNTVRTITRAEWRGSRRLIFDVAGDGFLYKMVRLMVGAVVWVAQGKAEPKWIADLLTEPASGRNSHSAPAAGLSLVRVFYSPTPERESRNDPE